MAPRAGHPALPVVAWPDTDTDTDTAAAHVRRTGLHWKTSTLLERGAGRTVVWIDDEITDTDRHRVADHHPGRALLHRVDPTQGLTRQDCAVIDS